jgi:hypothetical protein
LRQLAAARWSYGRRLRWAPSDIRADRADIRLAFLQLGCALISLKFLGEPVLSDVQLVRTVNLNRRPLPLLD